MGSSLPSFSFQPLLIGLLTVIIMDCYPMLDWQTLPFRYPSTESLVRGILSTSRFFCENNHIRTKSSLASFDSFQYSRQRVCYHFFQSQRCLDWIVNNTCEFFHKVRHFMHQHAAGSPLYLDEEVLSDSVNYVEKGRGLDCTLSCPSFWRYCSASNGCTDPSFPVYGLYGALDHLTCRRHSCHQGNALLWYYCTRMTIFVFKLSSFY